MVYSLPEFKNVAKYKTLPELFVFDHDVIKLEEILEQINTIRNAMKREYSLILIMNKQMGLWIRITPTIFTSPLLNISVLETLIASQEFSGSRVIRELPGQT